MKKSTRKKRLFPDEQLIEKLYEECESRANGKHQTDDGYDQIYERCMPIIVSILGHLLLRSRVIIFLLSSLIGALLAFLIKLS